MESRHKYMLASNLVINVAPVENIHRIKIRFSFYRRYHSLWFVHEIELETNNIKNIYLISSEEDIEKIKDHEKNERNLLHNKWNVKMSTWVSNFSK